MIHSLYLAAALLLAEPTPSVDVPETPTVAGVLIDLAIFGIGLVTVIFAGYMLFRKPRNSKIPGVRTD